MYGKDIANNAMYSSATKDAYTFGRTVRAAIFKGIIHQLFFELHMFQNNLTIIKMQKIYNAAKNEINFSKNIHLKTK